MDCLAFPSTQCQVHSTYQAKHPELKKAFWDHHIAARLVRRKLSCPDSREVGLALIMFQGFGFENVTVTDTERASSVFQRQEQLSWMARGGLWD